MNSLFEEIDHKEAHELDEHNRKTFNNEEL
jgi:hypothetical protein